MLSGKCVIGVIPPRDVVLGSHSTCPMKEINNHPAHIFHQNINSHLNAILQYHFLTDVETCVCIRQDLFNHCIKMPLNTPDKSLLSMNVKFQENNI